LEETKKWLKILGKFLDFPGKERKEKRGIIKEVPDYLEAF